MIEVSEVTKEFGPVTAVERLTFSVARGEVLGFLGPNGAGKTTTMRILTGFIPATRGTAVIAGHDVGKEPLAAKRKIGYLPENPPLYPEMTVTDYLEFVARIKKVAREKRRAKVAETIERCALGEVRDKLSGKLSKGYRQRVGLAQALIHDPEVLILDEPTAGLDPSQIHSTRSLIRSLGGDHTIILSTHILPEVAMTCDRVVIINRGRVIAQGTGQSLTEKFDRARIVEATVRGAEDDVKRTLSAIDGILGIEVAGAEAGASLYRLQLSGERDLRDEIAARIVGAGFGLLGLSQKGLTLEEVYLRVISSEEPAEKAEAAVSASSPEGPEGPEGI